MSRDAGGRSYAQNRPVEEHLVMENHEENNKVYGCLFCTTGKELSVVQRIQSIDRSVRAVAAQQEKYRTVHGEKSRVSEIF